MLRHVFEIAPELVKHPSDLLRVLLRRHYRGQRIPADLDSRFIQLLRQGNVFDDWPLETLVSDREAFFAFLQERWAIFLDGEAAKWIPGIGETKKPYGLTIAGPVRLPFDYHDVRVYIDNLFVEGLLRPVPHEHASTLSRNWVGIGVRTAPTEDRSRRLGKLLDSLEASIPVEDAKHTAWFHSARGWAEAILLANEQVEAVSEPTRQRISNLQVQADAAFTGWLFKRYAGLVNLPPVPPVMLHHLPRFLARQMAKTVTASWR